MNVPASRFRLAVLLLCATAHAVARDEPDNPYATEKICDGRPKEELQHLATAGDYKAAHVLGLRALSDRYDPDPMASARPWFAQGAAQHYPPALYWYAFVRGDGSNRQRYELIREASDRGYIRALLERAVYYADTKSPYYDRPTAYAWLTVCHRYDPLCRSETYEEYVPGLTAEEKAKGEPMIADIVAHRAAYPKFVDMSNCPGESLAPRE